MRAFQGRATVLLAVLLVCGLFLGGFFGTSSADARTVRPLDADWRFHKVEVTGAQETGFAGKKPRTHPDSLRKHRDLVQGPLLLVANS